MTEDEKLKAIEKGRAIDLVLSNPGVQNWFEQEKRMLLQAMVDAELADDETRKQCAFAFKALDKLKTDMQNAVSRANHIEKTGELPE